MPVGQQRRNKEAKKPKKDPAPKPDVIPSIAALRMVPAVAASGGAKH